jgi:two-component system, NtrC family, response regulator AtoC
MVKPTTESRNIQIENKYQKKSIPMTEDKTDKKQLLFIEEEGYVIERINKILSDFPKFEITYAENSEMARELLEIKKFDIVLSDIYIRGLSGLEAMHKAKEKNPDVCVIIIAGADTMDLAEKAIKEGAFDYILKPPNLEKLSNILKLLSMVRF